MINKGIITFKKNPLVNNLINDRINYAIANFKTVASGNYNNPLIWNVQDFAGNWVASETYPKNGNNIFIEATHTVTLTQPHDCKNFNFFNGEALNKINTGISSLTIYGTLRRYTGTAPGTTIISGGGNGTTQWMIGTYVITGTSRSQTVEEFVSASNLWGFTTIISMLDSNQSISFVASSSLSVNFGGTLNVSTGILFVQNAQIRTSDTINSDGIQNGLVIINSGGTIIWQGTLTNQMICKAATTANGFFNLQAGGSFRSRSTVANRIRSINNFLFGDFYLDVAGAQTFPAIADVATPALSYTNVLLQVSGVKTMIAGVQINGKLSFSGTASLALGGFVLTYNTNGHLEILNNKVRGVELPASSSGSAICRNLIIPTGVNYDLGGATVNIRGVLTGGGTVSNGTLNQNQP